MASRTPFPVSLFSKAPVVLWGVQLPLLALGCLAGDNSASHLISCGLVSLPGGGARGPLGHQPGKVSEPALCHRDQSSHLLAADTF